MTLNMLGKDYPYPYPSLGSSAFNYSRSYPQTSFGYLGQEMLPGEQIPGEPFYKAKDDPWYKTIGARILEGAEKYGDFYFESELQKLRNQGEEAKADSLAAMRDQGITSEDLRDTVAWAVGGTVAVVGIVALVIILSRKRRRR